LRRKRPRFVSKDKIGGAKISKLLNYSSLERAEVELNHWLTGL
jgi:hypothetical protein